MPAPLCRWYSGDVGGQVTATSCHTTIGDPVISVLSSTSPQRAGLACVGGNDDAIGVCPDNGVGPGLNTTLDGAFRLTFAAAPKTWYWFAVGPASYATNPDLWFRITSTSLPPPRSAPRAAGGAVGRVGE